MSRAHWIESSLRHIQARDYTHHPNTPRFGGSVTLTLSCGHTKRMKRSDEPKGRTRCYECALAPTTRRE